MHAPIYMMNNGSLYPCICIYLFNETMRQEAENRHKHRIFKGIRCLIRCLGHRILRDSQAINKTDPGTAPVP